MAITTTDKLVEGLAASERVPFQRAVSPTWLTTVAPGSLWTFAGVPGHGATPPTGAGEAPTRTTAGALNFTAPADPAKAYIAGFVAVGDSPGVLVLYDRLVHTSGLDGTVAAAQTINSAALTRYTDGKNVELFLEWYATAGTTARSGVTIDYVDQDGNASTSPAFTIPGGGTGIGRMVQVPLASGDYGVRSVTSITLGGTTGAVSNFGVTLVKRLAEVVIPTSGDMASVRALESGLPEIDNNACLALMAFTDDSTYGPMMGQVVIAKA